MNVRFLQLGWILLFAVLAVFALLGFQAPVPKIGSADINRMMEDSDFGKSVKDQLDKMRGAREGVLSFLDDYTAATVEQATQIRDLSLKPSLTKEEQAQLDSVKAQVIASEKKWKELAAKSSLTPEERIQLQEFADRDHKIIQLGETWVRDFTSDIDAWVQKEKVESNERARTAIQQVAKQEGYAMVYDNVFVPFCTNDITNDALVAMNANK